MKKSRVRISDLARSLDLSLCTVSKILNRSFDGFSYAPETIARVEAAAKKMDYRPNRHAQSLRTRKSGLIGFVLPTEQVAMFGSLTERLELEMRQHGYQVLIVHTRNDPAAEAELIPQLLDRNVDGLVWIPATARVKLPRVGLRPDFPAVILDRTGCTADMPFVATDNREAARAMAQRIHDMGHRRVGVINAPANDRSMTERLKGLRDVFGDEIGLRDTVNSPDAARMATMDLMSAGLTLTALVTLSESLAIGALSALNALRIRVPDDLSFAAFDDFPLAAEWTPPLTVVRQEIGHLAAATAELLVRRIKAPKEHCASVRISATLMWRESVMACRA